MVYCKIVPERPAKVKDWPVGGSGNGQRVTAHNVPRLHTFRRVMAVEVAARELNEGIAAPAQQLYNHDDENGLEDFARFVLALLRLLDKFWECFAIEIIKIEF